MQSKTCGNMVTYYVGDNGIKEKYTAKDMLTDEELDELLNDLAKLADVLEKWPPAPRKSKRQSSNKKTATIAWER